MRFWEFLGLAWLFDAIFGGNKQPQNHNTHNPGQTTEYVADHDDMNDRYDDLNDRYDDLEERIDLMES